MPDRSTISSESSKFVVDAMYYCRLDMYIQDAGNMYVRSVFVLLSRATFEHILDDLALYRPKNFNRTLSTTGAMCPTPWPK